MKKQTRQQNKQYIYQGWPRQDYLTQTTTRLLGGLKTRSGKGNGKTILASNTTFNHALKNRKVPATAVDNTKWSRIRIRHTRLSHGYLMSRNNQQPACGNATCGNQSLTIKHWTYKILASNGGTVERNKISRVTWGHYWERIVKWRIWRGWRMCL